MLAVNQLCVVLRFDGTRKCGHVRQEDEQRKKGKDLQSPQDMSQTISGYITV